MSTIKVVIKWERDNPSKPWEASRIVIHDPEYPWVTTMHSNARLTVHEIEVPEGDVRRVAIDPRSLRRKEDRKRKRL